jgi:acylglycerol lipase
MLHRRALTLVPTLALAATACGGRLPDPGLRLRGPAPAATAAIAWHEQAVTGDGPALYLQAWRPTAAPPRGVLVIHHGLADYGARYGDLARRLVDAGYAVWALDMRGHGRSAGPRVSSPSIDAYLDDLDRVMAVVRAAEPGRPVFLLGHSLGGLIATLYGLERDATLAGLVLSAPALAFPSPPLEAALIRTIAGVSPDARILATPHGNFSSDPTMAAQLDADPLVYAPPGPARTARAALDGVARVWARPHALTVPLLALHGTADRLTGPAGSRDLVRRAGGDDRTLRLYPGLAHDLLHEPGGAGATVAGEVRAWLDAHTGGPAVAFAPPDPSAPLAGDGRAHALAIELDARGAAPTEGDAIAVSGGLRVRAGLGRSGPGLGYLGGLDLRAGYEDGGTVDLDLHALGLALRRGGALVAVTGGVGLGGPRGLTAVDLPVEVAVEAPVGGVRVLARAGLTWHLTDVDADADAEPVTGLADQAQAFLGLRLGRDRRYWGAVRAGAGPFVGLTYQASGEATWLGLAIGAQLWGGR